MSLLGLLHSAGVSDSQEFAKHIGLAKVPFPHQVSNLRAAFSHSRYGIFDEPGTGKTLTAQAFALSMAGYGNRVVVVMPPVLLEQFKESLYESFPGFDKHISFYLLRDGPEERVGLIGEWCLNNTWPHILAMSYQGFIRFFYPPTLALQALKLTRRLKDAYPDDESEQKKIDRDHKRLESIQREQVALEALADAGYNVLIADEAHALKHPSTLQHRAVLHFLSTSKDTTCLLMTGTPIPNTLSDAYGLIKIINPTAYHSKATFERLHAIYSSHGKFQKLIGYKNKDLISIRLYANASRVTKDEVFTLDKPIVTEVPVVLSNEHLALYRKLVNERMLEVDGTLIDARTAQSLRMKCLQIVATPHEFTARKTIDNQIKATLEEMVDDLGVKNQELNDKVIIFANFHWSVETIVDWLRDLNPAVIYGSNTDHDAQRVKFLTDPTCRVLVANPIAGGVGLNLQSVCRYVIFAEPTSVPGAFKQASERVHRPGQTRVVSIWILKAIGTISPTLTKNMLKKERDILDTVKDRESLLQELLDQAPERQRVA